jgi:hypothetical protein
MSVKRQVTIRAVANLGQNVEDDSLLRQQFVKTTLTSMVGNHRVKTKRVKTKPYEIISKKAHVQQEMSYLAVSSGYRNSLMIIFSDVVTP